MNKPKIDNAQTIFLEFKSKIIESVPSMKESMEEKISLTEESKKKQKKNNEEKALSQEGEINSPISNNELVLLQKEHKPSKSTHHKKKHSKLS